MAEEALPGRSDVWLDRVALASLTGRRSEARLLAERWFSSQATVAERKSVRRALYAGDVIEVNKLIEAGQYARADSMLRADAPRGERGQGTREGRRRVPGTARRVPTRPRRGGRGQRRRARVQRGSGAGRTPKRPREAAEAFRRAERAAASDSMRTRSRDMAQRMQVRWRGQEAITLAKSGREPKRSSSWRSCSSRDSPPDERQWIETNLALLRERQGR
jgi:hypothetical protein